MIILKIIYCIILIILFLCNVSTLGLIYTKINEVKTHSEHSASSLLIMEIFLFIFLIILSIIINEKEFIFNFTETIKWAGGFFLFSYLHFLIVALIASITIFSKKK